MWRVPELEFPLFLEAVTLVLCRAMEFVFTMLKKVAEGMDGTKAAKEAVRAPPPTSPPRPLPPTSAPRPLLSASLCVPRAHMRLSARLEAH